MREHLEGQAFERLEIKKQMVCLVLLRDFSKWISTHLKINTEFCIITMSLKMGLAFIYLLGSLVSQKHKTKATGGH